MAYYNRNIDFFLKEWKESGAHKPLLLRGARQVGKSSAVRNLARSFNSYIEIDLEQRRDLHELFGKNLNISDICTQLSILFNTRITDGETLIFIDEIQSCPRAIAALRYFYEQRPNLHIIAAGSLLEFALAELSSFGVGRIESLYLYPFSFDEFLNALGQHQLVDFKKTECSPLKPLPAPIYEKLVGLFKEFMLIGGMPEVVKHWVQTKDYSGCLSLQNDILGSYRDDFAKYKTRISPLVLWTTLRSVAMQAGEKFVYSRVGDGTESRLVKEALSLLELAGIIHSVTHTSANGLPLGAEANDKYRKFLFMDTGLMLAMLNFDPGRIILEDSMTLINKGGIAEVAAGLEITKYSNPRLRSELFYWVRMAKNALAEVDYVTVINHQITPIEVKSGIKGAMQSLYIFLEQKKIERGIRTSLENFGVYNQVEIYPLYALSNLIK